MPRPRRDSAVPAGLALLSFAVALWQHPGVQSFDTKVHLHVAPLRFLADSASLWSPTTDLGHVQSGQYVGYLFPMGPFFAAGHLLGVPDWLVHRLWLGGLLALGAWGVVRLLDAFAGRPRGWLHAVAGAAFVLNPYVAVLANRASVTLLAYAALPWMLLAVHRGLRAPRGWWWPAALALLVAAGAGGVNAAVLGWVLVGPLLLLLYEPAVRYVGWRDARAFAWRAGLLAVLASLWWMGPVAAQSVYGIDFLRFIEQPGTVWGTTSAGEALRLMGYWVSYAGVGLAGAPVPVLSSGAPLLFAKPVVLASLLVPGLALAGFALTRRRPYAAFLVLLVVVGAGIVMAGFPEGTPLRHGLYFTYNHVGAVRFLRTSQKAAPLIALGLACLLGLAVAEARRRFPGRVAAGALAGGLALLLAAGAWPLTRGRAVGLTSDGVPAAWRAASHDLDRELPANSRAMVLPGQLFGFYRWGGVGDPILPALSKRPVAVRAIVPYGDLHATDLLWTVDRLVGQERLYPGQLRPLLGLLGVRSVVTATDDDRLRSGGPHPVRAARQLAGQGLGRPARTYGPARRWAPPPDELSGPVALPQIRRYDLPAARGLVSVERDAAPTVVDGSAEGLAQLAAFGALDPRTPLRYAGDLDAASIRRAAAQGGTVVVSDSNRRRVFANSRPRQNLGPTLAAGESVSEDAALLDPFEARGDDALTVAEYSGVRYLRAPYSPALSLFPEHRPFAAFDGSVRTAWIADRALTPDRRWIEVGFTRPRDVPWIDVVPEDDARGVVTAVRVAGRTFAIHPGRNRLPLGLRGVDRLRVRIVRVRFPPNVNGGAGGLREVVVPGLRVGEALRTPVVAERALAGADLSRAPLVYALERTTGDDPLHRSRLHGPWQAQAVRNIGDGEVGLRRIISPPAARRWTADAWLSLSPDAPDSAVDRLAGYRGPVRATSSGRFGGEGRFRASGAFDGTTSRAWIGEEAGAQHAWLAWRLPRPVTIRRLVLVPALAPVARPARVRLVTGTGARTAALPVSPAGVVVVPRALRSRAFRLDVVARRLPPGAGEATRRRRAVGIAEVLGAGVPRMRVPRAGALRAGCGAAVVVAGGQRIRLRVESDVRALDTGGPFRARACGAPVALARGRTLVTAPAGTFRTDLLALRSAAPRPLPPPAGVGRVVDPGTVHRSSVDGVRVALDSPGWLVLGETYDRGWRAWCDGRSLGVPTIVDAYANGWRAPRDCRAVRFAFAPQRAVAGLGIASGVACLLMLALLLVRRPPAVTPGPAPAAGSEPPRRWPWRRAAAAGAAAGIVLGFVLSIRAGVVIAPATAFVLWRGVGARSLSLLAGALLVVAVPAVYLLEHVPNPGGYRFNYAVDLIAGHWLAAAALVALLFAALRTAVAARG